MKSFDEKHRVSITADEIENLGKAVANVAQDDHIGLDASDLPKYGDKETKRILRKVDFRLLPVLTCLYILSFLDRSNIGNAKIAGMSKDLHLTGQQYNIALTVFFIPYALFEVPSNVVLKLMRPSHWIMILMVSWGAVMLAQGFVKDYEQLCVTRVLLGFTESGFFPAATYLLTTWYCRFEVQTRLAVFFSAASAAGAFSGVLAFAIQQMDGMGGLAGWRWIFILEGAITIAIGLTLHWTLPDSPESASFLTPYEKSYIARRLIEDAGSSSGKVRTGESFQWKYLKLALGEWKVYLAVIVYYGNSICLYGFSYTVPTIIVSLGYSSAQAQLMTIPPYILGVISTILFSMAADKYQTRWPFIVVPYGIALVGMIALLAIPQPALPGLTYAMLFLIPAGVYPALISVLTWVANNLAPSWTRAVGMATLISIGNFGGAIGSNIFLAEQAPRYWLGYGFCAGILTAAITCTFILRWAYLKENKKRDAMNEAEIREKYTPDQLLDMGHRSPLYRYVV